MKTSEPSAGEDGRKILLVGDIGKVFSDADAVNGLGCKVQANMAGGIDAASKDNFSAIGVVMSGTLTKLKPALETLRETNPDAKIILFAQMYQEPAAIELVNSARNGARIADDYLICPTQVSRFYESIAPGKEPEELEHGWAATVEQKMARKIKTLEKLATEDDLTGLKNRRYIREFSRQIIKRAKEKNGRVTLLVFDIDNFKHYNDVYGHPAGDEILRQAAALMRRCCRGQDAVGRIGGDEFAVVFWDEPQLGTGSSEEERRSAMAEHPKGAIFIAQRFRKALEKAEFALLGPEGKGVLTISGGLASFPRDGSTVQELFEQADKALLEAKRSGKNRIYLVGKPSDDIADIG